MAWQDTNHFLIGNRFVNTLDDICQMKDIDYGKVDIMLNQFRNKSINFLTDGFND